MANGLAVYGAVPNTIDLINYMGLAIAKSRLLGCENEEQGRVLAMTCIVKGTDPLTLSQKYDIIQGKLSMKAANMLAEFRMLGGRHKIIERTADAVEIQLTIGSETESFRLTWDEIKDEGYTKTKGGQLKENYSSPRRRMQMLWARLISDAVRAMTPEVNAGVYTPEEVNDFDNGDCGPVVEGKAVPSVALSRGDGSGGTPQTDASRPGPAFVEDGNALATGEQINSITQLFTALRVPADKQSEAIRKRGAADMGALTESQAEDLIAALLAKSKASATAETQIEEVSGESKVDSAAAVLPTSSRCIQEQVDEIKRQMREISQLDGQANIGERVKAKLVSHGLAKLNDLSYDEAEAFKIALSKKNLEAFFEMDLKGSTPF